MLRSIISKDFSKIRSDYDVDSVFDSGLPEKSINMLSRVRVHGSDSKIYVITIPSNVPDANKAALAEKYILTTGNFNPHPPRGG